MNTEETVNVFVLSEKNNSYECMQCKCNQYGKWRRLAVANACHKQTVCPCRRDHVLQILSGEFYLQNIPGKDNLVNIENISNNNHVYCEMWLI
ncbi:unnamed protein product [Allacma fusca]|uniref:Uncharacterized protein n=1 Tax=Allacma fusca TaxID=39272 RepID=A0A8J2LIX8_9HEXA|nr:unnamed protein product [Allacma fusca]